MILCILISIPIFNSDTWFDNVTSYSKSVSYLSSFTNNITEFECQLNLFIKEMVSKPKPLIFLSINISNSVYNFPNDFEGYDNTTMNLNNIRDFNVEIYNPPVGYIHDFTIVFDKTPLSVFQSQLNIGRTLFVCVIMIVVTLLFTRDV